MSTSSRAELDTLQARLASRASITHFAHASVALLLGLIASGAAGKAFWDLMKRDMSDYAVPIMALAALLFAYGGVRYVLGRRALAVELVDFDQLKILRSSLRLDDPSALLPR